MTKQAYISKNFSPDNLELIDTMNTVVDDYDDQGYRLTVRQLYYQLVTMNVIPNTIQSYKRMAGIVNDAKMAGLMDWEMIEDRTREFVRNTRWESASEILRNSADGFHMDLWVGQGCRIFVIVEKEALAGVLERPCRQFDVPLLAARGYPSGTVLREFTHSDLMPAFDEGQEVVILHLGDHDPSGIDMTRDLDERIQTFGEDMGRIEIVRIALEMDQIKSQKPPPNPAKSDDPRFKSYTRLYGRESWELDALKPEFLTKLVERHIIKRIEPEIFDARIEEVAAIRRKITAVADKFDREERKKR